MEWLKLEDLYSNLFLVKCRIVSDEDWKRNVGDPTAWYIKLGMGAGLFLLLVLLLWFPLFILVQGSPGSEANMVTQAQLTVSFDGYGEIFSCPSRPQTFPFYSM